jgi:thioredoxin-like negative regulator of GroEL
MTQAPKKSRRQMLEEFVAAHPQDAFARYGLAVECANSGDSETAGSHFKQLIEAHPDYVAGYFQYGQLLGRVGNADKAKATLLAGIDAARRTGDEHARSEMESALAGLA